MADVLQTAKSILTNDWNSVNTDDILPIIGEIVHYKMLDLANNDYVLLYIMEEPIDPFGIGAQEWAHLPTVSIDIRTTYKRTAIPNIRAHLIKIKEEVIRIIKSKVANPDSDYQLAVPRRLRDLSDKSIGIGRMVVDINLRHYGA